MYRAVDEQEPGYSIPTQRASRTTTIQHKRASKAITEASTLYDMRMPTSVRRYTHIYETQVVVHDPRKKQIPTHQTPLSVLRRAHWSVITAGSLAFTFALILVGGAISNAWNAYQDDMQFGTPRTYQTDALVGHGPNPSIPSHFIALNLDSHIKVIELPGNDASKAEIYDGPILTRTNTNSIPVTLLFKDVNHDGKLDMIMRIHSEQYTMMNDHGRFSLMQPGSR